MIKQTKPASRVIQPKILYFGTPVVLLSTLNEDGTTNLTPMSSAWALGNRIVLGLVGGSQGLANLRRCGECVVNLPDAAYWDRVELSEHFPNLNVDDEIFEAMEEAGTLNTAVPETTFEVVFFNFSVWHLFLFVHSPFILFW